MRLIAILLVVLLCPVLVAGENPLILTHGFITLALGPDVCFVAANQTKLDSLEALQLSLAYDGLYYDGGILTANSTCGEKGEKQPVFRFSYYGNCYEKGNAIETYTNRFEAAIKRAKECTGSDKVDIVAHSLGGIITRNYIQTRNNSDIGKVIFISTPHSGIGAFPIAFFMPSCLFGSLSPFCPSELVEMRTGSPFINSLNKVDKLNQSTYTLKSSYEFYIPQGSTDALRTDKTASVGCFHDYLFRPLECPAGYAKIKEFLGS